MHIFAAHTRTVPGICIGNLSFNEFTSKKAISRRCACYPRNYFWRYRYFSAYTHFQTLLIDPGWPD